MYIETLINIHNKFSKHIQEGFTHEQGFTAALDQITQLVYVTMH